VPTPRCRSAAPALVLLFAVSLSGCGGGGSSASATAPAPTPAPAPAPTPAPSGVAVRGAAYGLAGEGLAVSLNGGAAVAVAADGSFSFSGTLPAGSSAAVTVARQPTGPTQVCTPGAPQSVDSGTALFVRIDCVTPPPTLTGTLSTKAITLSWPVLTGSTSYQLQRQVAGGEWTDDGAAMPAPAASTTRELSAHLLDWATTRYRVRGCAGAACSTTAELPVLDLAAKAGGYLKASNTDAGDAFGAAVALSGDGTTLAIGAPGEDGAASGVNGAQTSNATPDAGAVYVFRNAGSGWTQQAYLKPATPAAGARFGQALALSRDGAVLAVGAPGYDAGDPLRVSDVPTNARAGEVHVFNRNASGVWSTTTRLTSSNSATGDGFGISLSLADAGTVLAVGAPGQSGGASLPQSGGAYVFVRAASTWSQRDAIVATVPALLENFGRTVALSGDGTTLAVAAPMDSTSATGAGSVHVLVRPSTSWTRQAYLKPPTSFSSDLFGSGLALSRDGATLAVGVALEDGSSTGPGTAWSQRGNDTADSGAVFVYTRSGTTWSRQAYLKAPASFAGDRFGAAIALSADGSTLAAGGPLDDGSSTGIGSALNRGRADSGGVTVYVRSAGTWSIRNHVKAPNTGDGDRFGTAIALSDDGALLAVGAPGEDGAGTGTSADPASNAAGNAGAILLY
jgi:hypothetical protein